MKHSFTVGFSFGLVSGIITTLGLIVGLHSGTHSRISIIGGILVIAVADALSDAMGIHISEESENKHSPREIWLSTLSTFLSKFICALTFLVPVLVLELTTAIIVCIVWGLFLITVFSMYLARSQHRRIAHIVAEHLILAIVVIILTHYVGEWVAALGKG